MELRPNQPQQVPPSADPADQFGTPENLLNHRKLTPVQKHKILEQWKYDLTLMQTANQENMQKETAEQEGTKGESAGSQGKSADLLRRVTNCLQELSKASPEVKKPH